MGGHGHDHHHHHEEYKVPRADIYKVEDAKELVYVRDELAKRGLTDPWLRNEVWRFNEKVLGKRAFRGFQFFMRGAPLGFAAFLATIAFEEYFGIYKDAHAHHEGYYDSRTKGSAHH